MVTINSTAEFPEDVQTRLASAVESLGALTEGRDVVLTVQRDLSFTIKMTPRRMRTLRDQIEDRLEGCLSDLYAGVPLTTLTTNFADL